MQGKLYSTWENQDSVHVHEYIFGRGGWPSG